VYANGRLLATYVFSQSDWMYAFNDWLGTKRVTTNASGTMTQTCQSLPFGDALNCSGGIDPSEHHFTGKERDTESGFASGNDYFGARYYASFTGRFLSPDYNETGDDTDPVPYADLTRPQSLNLYGYVGNNPLSRTDANGHVQLCGPETSSLNGNGDTVVNANCVDLPDPPTFRQTLRQAVYETVTSAPPGQQIPQISQQNPSRWDPLNLLYGGGTILSPKAKETLDKLNNGKPLPQGQKAGARWRNDGTGGAQKLPEVDANGNPITYKEYDVEPKQPGVDRTQERLLRGSDGSTWYTTNHYTSIDQVN
jgi:RHS repeat-associated protein